LVQTKYKLGNFWGVACKCEMCGGILVSYTNSISKHNYLYLGWLNSCMHDFVRYYAFEDWKSKSIGNLTMPIQIITPWFKCVTLGESSYLPPSSIESDLYWHCYSLCARDMVPPHWSFQDKAITYVPFDSWTLGKKISPWGAQRTPTAFNMLHKYTKYYFYCHLLF
jgi:hypothetical protein